MTPCVLATCANCGVTTETDRPYESGGAFLSDDGTPYCSWTCHDKHFVPADALYCAECDALEVDCICEEIASLESEIEDLEGEIDDLEGELSTKRRELRTLRESIKPAKQVAA